MNRKNFHTNFYISLFTLTLLTFVKPAFAQKEGYLEVLGSVTQVGKGLEGADIKVLKGNENADNVMSAAKGSFIINLDLGNVYTIIFSKNGTITKKVLVDTKVPDEYKSQIFSYKFKIELFPLAEGAEMPKDVEKAVAKLAFSEVYEDFDYDQLYTQTRKTEIEQVKKDMAAQILKKDAEKKALADKAKRDSLDVSRQQQLLAQAGEKAKQDSIAKEQIKAQNAAALEKRLADARLDSIANADKRARQEETARLANEKAKQDSIAQIQNKLRLDSIASAKQKLQLEEAALAKARLDSTNTAQAKAKQEALAKATRDKAVQDSIALVNEKARQQELANATREKAAQDSIARIEEKLRQDSIADANEKLRLEQAAQAKAKQEELALAKEKAKQDELAKALAAKTKQDSIAVANEKAKQDALAKATRDKAVQDSTTAANEKLKQQQLATAAREKTTRDSIANVEQKAKADALALATAKAKEEELAKQAKEKAERDAIAKAEQKAKDDAIASAKEKARQDEIEKQAKEKAQRDAMLAAVAKAKQDSIAAATEKVKLELARQKATQDSIVAAKEKAKADELARFKREQFRNDSIAQANKEQQELLAQKANEERKKQDAEAYKKRLADIEAQKQKMAIQPKDNMPKDISYYRFDFDKEAVPEGIKSDTILEKNRNIVRSVVKFKDLQATYLKVSYDYGAVFYFKNSTSISETIYSLDLKNLKAQLK